MDLVQQVSVWQLFIMRDALLRCPFGLQLLPLQLVPHCHLVATCAAAIDQGKRSTSWQRLTGSNTSHKGSCQGDRARSYKAENL